jgi:hypothetical protein
VDQRLGNGYNEAFEVREIRFAIRSGTIMTERQHDEHLLSELLQTSGTSNERADEQRARVYQAEPFYEDMLTRQEERALLREANEIGTPTLAPQETTFGTATSGSQSRAAITHGSIASELTEVVRRYPIPMLLAGAGLAYVLTRRRR